MHSFLCVLLIHLFDLYLWPLGYFWSMCWIYALDFLLLYPILSLKTRCREMRLHSAEIYSGVLQLSYFHPLKCSTPLYGAVLRCSVLSFSTHRTLWICTFFFFLLLCYCQIERRLMTLRMLTNATTLTMPLCHNIRSQSQAKLLWFRDNPLGKCWRQDLLLRVWPSLKLGE